MNEHDSERIAGLLEADGLRPATGIDDADVVVLNTCCIRENADNKLYGHLGHLKALKADRPDLQIVVGGLPGPEGPRPDPSSGRPTSTWCSAPTTSAGPPSCSASSAPPDGPVVEILEATVADDARRRSRRRCRSRREVAVRRRGSPSRSAATTRARSASCPRCGAARSAARSTTWSPRSRRWRPTGSPRSPCSARTSTPTGATSRWPVARPARPCGCGRCSPTCCGPSARSTASGGSGTRARTPRTCAPRPSRRWPRRPTVCEHLHLPLQAGSDRVLAAMHRGYTAERYLERLAAARAAMPDLAVTTDIIVGFPGETDDDFERTLEVAAEAGYDSAYTFIYSPRPGTEAAERIDRVRPARGRRRAVRAPARGRRALGPGAAPGPHRSRRGGRSSRARPARTRRYSPAAPGRTSSSTSRAAEPLRAGTLRRVRVTAAAPHHLTGELVEVTAAARHRTRIPVASA